MPGPSPGEPRAEGPGAEYRIEELAHRSGATVRTIRAYQDRGLLPRPERRGRANLYGEAHLARLRQITELLDRGYTLASIKELLEAWDNGRGLGGVLGLVAEAAGPWSDEETARTTRAELAECFGGAPDVAEAVTEAVELGVLEPVPGRPDEFLVPSPAELAVAAELHSAGVPLLAISTHLRELRGQVEHIAARFLDFTTEYVFERYLDHPPSDAEAAEAASLVRRLRPLAQATVDAELARAMRTLATRYVRHRLAAIAAAARTGDPSGDGAGPGPYPGSEAVPLPAATVRAVRALVGPDGTAGFIAAAADREVAARTMDALAAGHHPLREPDSPVREPDNPVREPGRGGTMAGDG
ncbi:MerR family transcriptional regulator [Streptomyces sp. XD-27]|uniref:MerR family transcriptional regulator n=1 Tax=Streptomyces sp. XD-27 TaxID=3062779 RepID=UPI0026F44454|nr:MerR family transcriptional regulator [Streptomyces sp. XD-27]WKX71590.1 MerR family transcriptional regulator [Streptomyces sp. XD-27]